MQNGEGSMIREINYGKDATVLNERFAKGLGEISFYHPVGTFALTPASYVIIDAIINHQNELQGIGIDWGSGIGCLAILASKIKTVERVYGLEISENNVVTAKKNAEENGVADKVRFMLSDSYDPYEEKERLELKQNRGKVHFVLANPPSSEGDDGFEFRRIVLRGAKEYLCKDGFVFLNVSFQYGAARIEELCKTISGFSYEGVAASTDYVPFDLGRADLLECLKIYAKEEQKGGSDYTFFANTSDGTYLNARTALEEYNKIGKSPLTKWQTHLFRYTG